MDNERKRVEEAVKRENEKFGRVREEMGKVIVGQQEVIDRLFIALLADGHVLVEGLPGLAKTLIVNSLAKAIRCECKRVQFTPDLLPADLIGTTVYNPKEAAFTVKKGPIFTNLLLADEINRAPAKVQSALLEVMQERQVTIGGKSFKTGVPFMVMATQNPVEQEGTYPLPEAQTDRFMMKIRIDYPSMEEEREIIARMGSTGEKPEVQPVLTAEEVMEARAVMDRIYIDEKIVEYILNLVFATREPERFGVPIEGLLLFGASPRAGIALQIAAKGHAFLSGRGYVTPHDVKQVGYDIFRHRLRRTYEAEAEDLSPDEIVERLFETIPVP